MWFPAVDGSLNGEILILDTNLFSSLDGFAAVEDSVDAVFAFPPYQAIDFGGSISSVSDATGLNNDAVTPYSITISIDGGLAQTIF